MFAPALASRLTSTTTPSLLPVCPYFYSKRNSPNFILIIPSFIPFNIILFLLPCCISDSFSQHSLFLIISFSMLLHVTVDALGSASTTAVVSGTATVCGIVAGESTQSIRCYQNINSHSQTVSARPNTSFESISWGYAFFCGLKSNGFSILCWDTAFDVSDSGFEPRRIYNSLSVRMTDLAVGDDQVCAREVSTGVARCWRGERGRSLFLAPGSDLEFSSITSGSGFSCGILANNGRVSCWGNNAIAGEIQKQFGNLTMSTLVAGVSHACGLTVGGKLLVCKGRDEFDQPSIPPGYSGIVAGANFSCAIRGRNGQVVCWGEGGGGGGGGGGGSRGCFEVGNESFETIVAGSNFVCGLVSSNLTVICWGPGWSNRNGHIPIGTIIPGPCVRSQCITCGTYPNSDNLCHGSGNICRLCQVDLPVALPLPPLTLPPAPRPVSPLNRLSLSFVIIGGVGALAGICATVYCLQVGGCGKSFSRKSDDSGQVTAPPPTAVLDSANMLAQRRDKSSVSTRRERSESWSKHADIVEKFSLTELSDATRNFSLDYKIGSGRFGTVYRGFLADGREVAIKRGETGMIMKKYQEKETAFGSELAILSRLNHKHLVRLIGFCREGDEWLLVYEYMSNGTLHGLLHSTEKMESGGGSSSGFILNSWKMRIKIALDAARGIKYLHNYVVPPIIHRDIKSSNILLDAEWTGRISDFGLSLIWPESDKDYMSGEAVGTVGFIDPEYYVMNALTTKSDMYGFGVVLLQLLTGKRAVFKDEEDGSGPRSLVEYAVPRILAGDLRSLLDKRIEPPATTRQGRWRQSPGRPRDA